MLNLVSSGSLFSVQSAVRDVNRLNEAAAAAGLVFTTVDDAAAAAAIRCDRVIIREALRTTPTGSTAAGVLRALL
jgi:hypothetical protein